MAPLAVKGNLLGTLSLSSNRVGAVSWSHEALIQLMADQMAVALEKAFMFDDKVMVEQYIEGREITVGILGNDVLTPLPASYHFPYHIAVAMPEVQVPTPAIYFYMDHFLRT